jgi:hypothetical protein
MNWNRHIISLVLTISMVGGLALSASAYVSCANFEADEFLDIAQIYQNPNSPILALHLTNNPLNPPLPKLLHFKKINPFVEILRC